MNNENTMKDMVAKYKLNTNKKQNPGAKKKIKKSEKKLIDQALRQALDIASNGEIALTIVKGKRFVMLAEEKLPEAIQNAVSSGQFMTNLSPEMKKFVEIRNEVLTVMSKLSYELLDRDQFETDEDYEIHKNIVKRNEEMFGEFDSWTFTLSDALGKTPARRKKVMEEYVDFRKKWPVDEILNSKVESTVV